MIKKRSCSLSTKINWHFSDMVKIRFIMTNNVNIFTLYESLLQNVMQILRTIFKKKTNVLGKSSKFQV